MRGTFIILASLCVCGAAMADGFATWNYVPYVAPVTDFAYDIGLYESEAHCVIDFQVNVDPGDKWTAASAYAYLLRESPDLEAAFWDHPSGGNIPVPATFVYFGLAAYDSFWTCTEEYPNPDLNPSSVATTFAPGSPIQNTDSLREAEWYADPGDPEADGGLYTLARYNVTGDLPFYPLQPDSIWLVISGDLYFSSTGGTPHPFSLTIPARIPEPTSLSLLLIGAAAALRRR